MTTQDRRGRETSHFEPDWRERCAADTRQGRPCQRLPASPLKFCRQHDRIAQRLRRQAKRDQDQIEALVAQGVKVYYPWTDPDAWWR